MGNLFYAMLMIAIGIVAIKVGDFWNHDLSNDFIGGNKIKFFIIGLGLTIFGVYILIQ